MFPSWWKLKYTAGWSTVRIQAIFIEVLIHTEDLSITHLWTVDNHSLWFA